MPMRVVAGEAYMRRTIIFSGVASFMMAFFGMLLASTLTPPGAVGAQGVDRAAIVQQWIDARNRYDVDAVMALLTDTAVAAHGRQCLLPTPCVGEANRPVFTGDAPAQA